MIGHYFTLLFSGVVEAPKSYPLAGQSESYAISISAEQYPIAGTESYPLAGLI